MKQNVNVASFAPLSKATLNVDRESVLPRVLSTLSESDCLSAVCALASASANEMAFAVCGFLCVVCRPNHQQLFPQTVRVDSSTVSCSCFSLLSGPPGHDDALGHSCMPASVESEGVDDGS